MHVLCVIISSKLYKILHLWFTPNHEQSICKSDCTITPNNVTLHMIGMSCEITKNCGMQGIYIVCICIHLCKLNMNVNLLLVHMINKTKKWLDRHYTERIDNYATQSSSVETDPNANIKR